MINIVEISQIITLQLFNIAHYLFPIALLVVGIVFVFDSMILTRRFFPMKDKQNGSWFIKLVGILLILVAIAIFIFLLRK